MDPLSSSFERPNILVVGGAGFLGSHLCDRLVRHANVVCVDNFSTGALANIDHLLQDPAFEFLHHDITVPLGLETRPELARFGIAHQGIQEIYHLACPVSRQRFDEFKIPSARTSAEGTRELLDLAVKYRAKFLFASTGALYGPRDASRPRAKESDPCAVDHLAPHGIYEEGKRYAESLVRGYADVSGIDAKIARIFRTYGPRMKIYDGNLIPDLVLAALEHRDMVLPGDESTDISLAFVSDVVDGLMRLMAAPSETWLLNLGSDQPTRLVFVAQLLSELVGSASRIRFERPSSRDAGLPDITRAREAIGWVPLVRLEDGLRRMVDYAKSHRHLISF
jgi:UDP-glucuronate decarboxylase